MSKPLVLITGATGHIGFRTLAHLLKAGYSARVSSRSLATAEKLKALPSIKPYADSVTFIEISDFFAENAFDEAVKDVQYVLHIASPIPDPEATEGKFDPQKDFIEPAIQGTVGMLKAAAKSPSVERVVITSSVAILAPKPGASTIGPDDMEVVPPEAAIKANPWVAYKASKILAYEAAEEFRTKENPPFDVIYILPGFVQGRNEPVTTAQGLRDRVSSNGTMIEQVLGKKVDEPRPTNLVHVDDVAAIHIAALDSTKAKNGENYIATHPKEINSYADVDPIVKKLFPEAVKNGLLPLGGQIQARGGPFDPSKTTRDLGVEFQGLEAMVESLIGQYVELASK